ncbi:MAG TPA: hypothetical protein VD994_17530 [Prosthecobacter sp.]|nr:hypothetical protein [Prosthecobacter sp.]
MGSKEPTKFSDLANGEEFIWRGDPYQVAYRKIGPHSCRGGGGEVYNHCQPDDPVERI